MPHSLESLNKKISSAKNKVEVGGIYFHYKNPDQHYVVESIGFIEESEEVCVVYRALYDEGLVWVRTLANFTQILNSKNSKIPRFQKVE